MSHNRRTILMTGGGTLGPVTPLLAVAEEWKRREPDVRIVWIGTPRGPERMLVEEAGFEFYALSAPKLSRHQKWTWPFLPFLMAVSCAQALALLRKLRPSMIFTAGAYVSVPVVWASALMRIPVWLHQLDLVAGLANKMMAPFAARISVTWTDSLEDFPERKTIQVGSLVRESVYRGSKARVMEKHGFDANKPVVFVLGGGTGAVAINEAMAAVATELLEVANVAHITGPGKMIPELERIDSGYAVFELLGAEIADYFAAADVVVGRAGMGTILTLAALGKAAILLPLPNADQMANAKRFEEAEAGEVMTSINGQILRQAILHLLQDDERRNGYGYNVRHLFMPHGEERIVKEAMEMLEG